MAGKLSMWTQKVKNDRGAKTMCVDMLHSHLLCGVTASFHINPQLSMWTQKVNNKLRRESYVLGYVAFQFCLVVLLGFMSSSQL